MRSEHDDWWDTLTDERKASVHRWLTKARPPHLPDYDTPLFADDGAPVPAALPAPADLGGAA